MFKSVRSLPAGARRPLEIVAVIINFLAVVVTIVLHNDNALNSVLGLGPAIRLADRFDNSYGSLANGPYPVEPSDPAWDPTIRLFKKYSAAKFDFDRATVITRSVAVSSAEIPGSQGNDPVAQWTAPETPIYVYTGPIVGNKVLGDSAIVGNIGDFHDWIRRDRDDIRFIINNVIIAFLVLANGILLLLVRENGEAPRGR